MTASAASPPSSPAWLILAYRLPASHGPKTKIRRGLTAIGAVFPVHRVAAVPASHAAERAFRRMRSMIGQAGGSAQILRAGVIQGASDLVAAFNKAREQEYAEIIAGCRQILAGIEALTAAGQFRYRDLADKDRELKRLSMRDDTIRTRDILGAANAGLALSALVRCRAVVDDFATHACQTDSASITGIVRRPRRRRV